jgi:GAF domain-containing protein
VLKENHGFFWVGFYMVKNEELILGPFQGPVACTRIEKNKGVCGRAWSDKKSILVENVHEFPGHISCNEKSKSELVVPVFNQSDEVVMVLDVDHDELNYFDFEDVKYLEKIGRLISKSHG